MGRSVGGQDYLIQLLALQVTKRAESQSIGLHLRRTRERGCRPKGLITDGDHRRAGKANDGYPARPRRGRERSNIIERQGGVHQCSSSGAMTTQRFGSVPSL